MDRSAVVVHCGTLAHFVSNYKKHYMLLLCFGHVIIVQVIMVPH